MIESVSYVMTNDVLLSISFSSRLRHHLNTRQYVSARCAHINMRMRSIRQYLNVSEECLGQNEIRRADGVATAVVHARAVAVAQLSVRVRQRLEHVVVYHESTGWTKVRPQ